MITQITRAGNPFPADGTSRDRNGVIHFDDLPCGVLEVCPACELGGRAS